MPNHFDQAELIIQTESGDFAFVIEDWNRPPPPSSGPWPIQNHFKMRNHLDRWAHAQAWNNIYCWAHFLEKATRHPQDPWLCCIVEDLCKQWHSFSHRAVVQVFSAAWKQQNGCCNLYRCYLDALMHCLNCFMACINSNIGGYFFVTQPPEVRGKKYLREPWQLHSSPPHTSKTVEENANIRCRGIGW